MKAKSVAGRARLRQPEDFSGRKGYKLVVISLQNPILDRPVSELVVCSQGTGIDLNNANLNCGQVSGIDSKLAGDLVGNADDGDRLASENLVN